MQNEPEQCVSIKRTKKQEEKEEGRVYLAPLLAGNAAPAPFIEHLAPDSVAEYIAPPAAFTYAAPAPVVD